ncbi:hypothetical protein LINPERHAP1_LOCUS13408 [Linum perenne]
MARILGRLMKSTIQIPSMFYRPMITQCAQRPGYLFLPDEPVRVQRLLPSGSPLPYLNGETELHCFRLPGKPSTGFLSGDQHGAKLKVLQLS